MRSIYLSKQNNPEDSGEAAVLMAAQLEELRLRQWEQFFEPDERELAPYLRRLIAELYIAEAKNRPTFKTTALRLIPVKHTVSAQKYLTQAAQKGWLIFIPDKIDKRRIIVKQSPHLLRLFRE